MDVGCSWKIKYKYERNLEQSTYKKVISSVETESLNIHSRLQNSFKIVHTMLFAEILIIRQPLNSNHMDFWINIIQKP